MIISTSLIHGQEILNMAKKETTEQNNKQKFHKQYVFKNNFLYHQSISLMRHEQFL